MRSSPRRRRIPVALVFLVAALLVLPVGQSGRDQPGGRAPHTQSAKPSPQTSDIEAARAAAFAAVNGPGAIPRTAAACDHAVAPGHATCFAERRSDIAPHAATPNFTPAGYSPSDLQDAYGLQQISSTAGAGRTVALILAYDNPSAESDLAIYRAQFGLPACTTANGCFRKVNQNGEALPLPTTNTRWAGENSLDLQMVSAVCPLCHLLLVEADGDGDALFAAINRAVAMGAKYVSNSWGTHEFGIAAEYDALYLDHPGVVITASTGDYGYAGGISYPASSPHVISVGGTTLFSFAGTWLEMAWTGAGSGCSAYEARPWFQDGNGAFQGSNSACDNRAVSDVAATADTTFGVAAYVSISSGTRGWGVWGGTSVSAPIIAAMYALAGVPGGTDRPASYPYAYANSTNLYDVVAGSNRGSSSCPQGSLLCNAVTGWDGPTGLGSPRGVDAFVPNVLTITNPGDQVSGKGVATSLQLQATATRTPADLFYGAAGLPPGLGIDPLSGVISGAATVGGSYSVTVTATDRKTRASDTKSFRWTVPTVSATNPGNQSSKAGDGVSCQIRATDSVPTATLSYSANLPPGLSIGATSGLITGTPTAAGMATVTVTDNFGASATFSFNWAIASVNVTNPGNQTSAPDVSVAVQIRATDSDPGASLTYSAAGLPPALSIGATSGLITGTPTTSASYAVTVHVLDSVGASADTSFTWTVGTIVLINPGSQSDTSESQVTLQIRATNTRPGATTAFRATGLPPGLSIDALTGLITGKPAAGFFAVAVTVTDEAGINRTISFSWTVVASGAEAGTTSIAGGGRTLLAPAAVHFTSTLNGTAAQISADQSIAVADDSGTGAGWNVTLTTTVFSDGAHALPATSVTDAGAGGSCDQSTTCTKADNAVSYPVPVPAGVTVAPTAATIMSASKGKGMGAQTWVHHMELHLRADTRAGTYRSTWIYSLVTGP
ncbi:MAG TPA: putative Ig domain-containing protein [Jatrophihabitans sp.]